MNKKLVVGLAVWMLVFGIAVVASAVTDIPATLSVEWLQGKTLYPVLFPTSAPTSAPISAVYSFSFASSVVTVKQLVPSQGEATAVPYLVDPSGLLFLGWDVANPMEIVCGSTPQYIKVQQSGPYGVFAILLFFNENDALAYATTLTSAIPKCPIGHLTPGWNLVGISIYNKQPLSVTDLGEVTSVWKWATVNSTKTWAVYLPSEGSQGDYAASKGFGELDTINPGEGFWVNMPASAVTPTLPSALPSAVGNYSVSSAFTESCWTGVATQNYTLSIDNQQPDGTFTTSDLPGLSSSNSKVKATEVTGKMTPNGDFSGSFKIYGGSYNGEQSGAGIFVGTLSGNNITIHAIGNFNGACAIDGTLSGSK